MNGEEGFTGAVVEHKRLAGAHIARIMHPPSQDIAAHGHDWPALILSRVGGYREIADDGAAILDGPSVVFQPANIAHADTIGDAGLETLTMTFDPAWLSPEARAVLPQRITWRSAGAAVAAAGRLARIWRASDADADQVRAATCAFILDVFGHEQTLPTRPDWLDALESCLMLEGGGAVRAAKTLDRHPAWLARAYRNWRGEGIPETVRRRRVERAMLLLREGADPLADIAVACGFCDQSHMNRAFAAVLGRTPLHVRREAALLKPYA